MWGVYTDASLGEPDERILLGVAEGEGFERPKDNRVCVCKTELKELDTWMNGDRKKVIRSIEQTWNWRGKFYLINVHILRGP